MDSSSMIISNPMAVPDAQTMSAGTVQINQHEQINMYNEPPQNIITLHEFMKLSFDRIQVLQKIESMFGSISDDKSMAE